MIEYLDVLDKEGNKTGRKLPRNEVNENGLWHLSVNLWLVTPDHKILLCKRPKDKDAFPDVWAHAAAGHVSSGEDSLYSIIKEAKEEINLDLIPDDLSLLFSYPKSDIVLPDKYIHNSWFDVYLANKDISVNDMEIDPEKIQEAKLVTIDELEQMTQTPGLMLPFPYEYPKIIKLLRKEWKNSK